MVPLHEAREGGIRFERRKDAKGRRNILEAGHDGYHAKDDEWEKTVTQHRCCTVGVDATLGHEVEEGVDGSGADESDAVDIGELRLAGLRMRFQSTQFDFLAVEHSRVGGSWQRRSRRRAVPRGRHRP